MILGGLEKDGQGVPISIKLLIIEFYKNVFIAGSIRASMSIRDRYDKMFALYIYLQSFTSNLNACGMSAHQIVIVIRNIMNRFTGYTLVNLFIFNRVL